MTSGHISESTADGAVPQRDAGRLLYIDGLRAIAILSVIGFHAGVPGMPGGFVGVDIFFVISGFVITRLIVAQVRAGRFRVMDFYARRMLRIFPPLLLVTAVTLIGAMFFPLIPRELEELDHSAAATMAMASNFYFGQGIEYFAMRSQIQPLLHTWSLGVEEQYYLLAPWAIIGTVALATRRSWPQVRLLLAVGGLFVAASFIASLILTYTDHRMAFYSVVSRAWQFGVGGGLAVIELSGAHLPRALGGVAAVVGLLTIAASVALIDGATAYPGWIALLPIFGTALLIAAGIADRRTIAIRMLTTRPAIAIGAVSYSWYLWHWPLLAFLRSTNLAHDSLSKKLAVSALALLLAAATYLWVERPMKSLRQRNLTRNFGSRVIAIGLGVAAVLAVVALVVSPGPSFAPELNGKNPERSVLVTANCRPPRTSEELPGANSCLVGPERNPAVLFWGDSHAGSFYEGASRAAQSVGRAAIVSSYPACPPLPGLTVEYGLDAKKCDAHNDAIAAWLRSPAASGIDGVVMIARWPFYSGRPTPSGDEMRPPILHRLDGMPDTGFAQMLAENLRADGVALGSLGKRVLLIGPVPELTQIAPDCILRAEMYRQPLNFCAIPRTEVEARRRESVAALKNAAANLPNVRYIDPIDVFCDAHACRPYGARGILYSDDNHLSAAGARQLYEHFSAEFRWVFGADAKRR